MKSRREVSESLKSITPWKHTENSVEQFWFGCGPVPGSRQGLSPVWPLPYYVSNALWNLIHLQSLHPNDKTWDVLYSGGKMNVFSGTTTIKQYTAFSNWALTIVFWKRASSRNISKILWSGRLGINGLALSGASQSWQGHRLGLLQKDSNSLWEGNYFKTASNLGYWLTVRHSLKGVPI